MPLQRCLSEVSHREYLTWMAWFEMDQNRPDRSDHYAMQIAAEVRRGNSKNPRKVLLEHFKIPFRRASERPKPKTVEEATAQSRARWGWIPKWAKVPPEHIPVRSGDDIELVE